MLNPTTADATAAAAADYEMSKYLGGTQDTTHLVKGLDFALAEKNRREYQAEAERQAALDAAAAASGNAAPLSAVPASNIAFRSAWAADIFMAAAAADDAARLARAASEHGSAAAAAAAAAAPDLARAVAIALGIEQQVQHDRFMPGRVTLRWNVDWRSSDFQPQELLRAREDCPPPEARVVDVQLPEVMQRVKDAVKRTRKQHKKAGKAGAQSMAEPAFAFAARAGSAAKPSSSSKSSVGLALAPKAAASRSGYASTAQVADDNDDDDIFGDAGYHSGDAAGAEELMSSAAAHAAVGSKRSRPTEDSDMPDIAALRQQAAARASTGSTQQEQQSFARQSAQANTLGALLSNSSAYAELEVLHAQSGGTTRAPQPETQRQVEQQRARKQGRRFSADVEAVTKIMSDKRSTAE